MGGMAQSTPNFSQAIYAAYVDDFACDYALAVNPGHPLLGNFDQQQYNKDYATFLERVNTPEKLLRIADARFPMPD
jgi:hypothetical protein